MIRTGKRPIISNSQKKHGSKRIYSCSLIIHWADGAPTVGGINESMAPKAVIDWLNGRAKGYSSREGSEEEIAFWSTGKVMIEL